MRHNGSIVVTPPPGKNRVYIPVSYKLAIATLAGFAWCGLSLYLALPWVEDLSKVITPVPAWLAVVGVALIPGLANAFVITGLLLDKRPIYPHHRMRPSVSILVAAYNEESSLAGTLDTLLQQEYGFPVEIIVIDDGSTDSTAAIAQNLINQTQRHPHFTLQLIRMPQNSGKANALNAGLKQASHDLIITVDADTCMWPGSLAAIVHHMIDGPPNTAAVAGTVLVRNSRKSFFTRLQEWDYFHAIAVTKRIQSLFQGTLVAQGAFSIYRRDVLEELGGWPSTLGEDIVLTWGMLAKGYRIGYAENAFVFTNVPESYKQLYQQRKRWSRGLIEAFKHHPSVLVKLRFNTPFIYLNLLFPYLDLAFLLVLVSGVIAAVFFQFYLVVGILTLTLLPFLLIVNAIMFTHQRAIFHRYGLKVRRNLLGFLCYTLIYQLLMLPANLMGYASELFNMRKRWGTK